MSFKECTKSFDGLAACGVNDTLFVNSHVGNKGGAVAVEDVSASTYIELHRCTVENATAGIALEEDPQGEGGGFSVGQGATLVLANCTLRNNTCGKKVGLDFGCSFDVLPLPSTGGSNVRCCVPENLLTRTVTANLLTQEEPLQSDVVPVQAPQVPVRIHLRLNNVVTVTGSNSAFIIEVVLRFASLRDEEARFWLEGRSEHMCCDRRTVDRTTTQPWYRFYNG